MAATSTPPVQEQLAQVITQLDALIRGRKIDLMLLRISASILLSSSFETDGEDVEAIVKQSTKIFNMLRSPRFYPKVPQSEFPMLRAAASILIMLKDDGTPKSTVETMRLISKSAAEISQLNEEKGQALKIIKVLEEKWASFDDMLVSRLQPNELKECELLVVEALLLKIDVLSEIGTFELAIDVLTNPELKRLMLKLKNPLMILSSKAFKCGQKLLMSREATKDTQHHNAAIASQCYTACIDLLRTESDDPMRESSTHSIHKSDENDLKSKCLVQLALALHLSEKHDEALDALNLVESKELLQDAEDLRFGILLATNSFDELHYLINGLIHKLSNGEGFKTPMRFGEAGEVDRILLLLRRVGFATNFDANSMQHYHELQNKWQDDHRYLEVRTQLLSGLLANTQRSPLISEGLLFNKSLELCDNMLYEHKARQRILTETHMSTVEVSLIHALNGTFSSGDFKSVIELSSRLIICLDMSSSQLNGENDQNKERLEKYTHTLVMQADAYFELGQLDKSLSAATQSFDLAPSSEAFIIKFHCLYNGGAGVTACQDAIQVLESKSAQFSSPLEILHALSQIISLLGSNKAYGIDAVDTGNQSVISIDTPEDIEIVALAAYVRTFEHLRMLGAPSSSISLNEFTDDSEVTSSFAAFLLRVYHIGYYEREGDASSTKSSNLESRLLTSTQCLLSGAHFLLQEESVGHMEYAKSNQIRLLNSHEEVRSLSMACWDTAQRLNNRGLVSVGSESSRGDESGFSVTTNLLLAAHELLLAAERIEKVVNDKNTSNKTEENMCEDEATGMVLPLDRKIDNALNRVGLLTMAASNVIDTALLHVDANKPNTGFTNDELPEFKKLQATKALEWIEMAQDICQEVSSLISQQQQLNGVDQKESFQNWESLKNTADKLRVTLSTLRLMAGINGIYLSSSRQTLNGPTPIEDSSSRDSVVGDLLTLVEHCKEDLAIVPPDTLRAAASAMKLRGKSQVSFSLLNIAIDRLQKALSSLSGAQDHEKLKIIKQLLTLNCDLFHVSPSTDGCLEIVEGILKLLEFSNQMAPMDISDSFDSLDIENITCLCYNWGLQGLSLGSINSGNECERLIGKAQQLRHYCPNLLHYEEDFIQAYQRALEVKEQQHEAITIHTQRMSIE